MSGCKEVKPRLFISNVEVHAKAHHASPPPPRIRVSEYPIPDYSGANFVSIVSPSELYVFSERAVYIFNGVGFKELYRVSTSQRITAGDCNGKYLAIATAHYQYLLPDYHQIIMTLKHDGADVTVSRTTGCRIAFTHESGCMKFLDKDVLFLGGLLTCPPKSGPMLY